jgi:hypothetical protein
MNGKSFGSAVNHFNRASRGEKRGFTNFCCVWMIVKAIQVTVRLSLNSRFLKARNRSFCGN